ncbi:hypothetical protein H6F88_10565 [Oculatella sp. FACHB-28]|uniref:hypothetical protein n=1 Tax=Oculatella sp. FACHB-28 TaxID=2692845 RepID=UPI001688B5CF|nr:hypothetical protein [Oculatella sp. FACHB-28]MBD2056450.1 hypothetical protein [Oculatella sp. FACHB-28]
MTNNRNINFGSNGTYNETVQVQGDFVQGNKIQSRKIIEEDLTQAVINIQRILHQMQSRYPLDEAQQKAATELANRVRKNPEAGNILIRLGNYIATNGGIEAGIGKVVELSLKLLGI